ncbi:hypothetical protein [Acinetobacter puyangensis]|uniref:hypothetical protein n=1 Tax=Acinetobacter puyangensis TaxID=1096779 RepID=UPI003A4D8BF1
MNHGLSSYQYYGCRCEICKRANIENTKKYLKQAQIKFASEPSNFKNHGLYGYRIGCRCHICVKEAKKTSSQSYVAGREYFKATGGFKSDKTKHGTSTAYQYGCLCQLCQKWKKDQHVRLRSIAK